MNLRRTTTRDPEFRALIAELDAELRVLYGDLQAAFDPHNVLPELATAIVARDGDRAVGCGCFRSHAEATVEIKRMFVAPAARGRGVARAVLAALEAWASELGYRAAVLELADRQPGALALYERSGYHRTAKFPPYTDMAPSICMRKDLFAVR